jgi:tryptophanyl-tRNA synthetase
MEIAGYASKLPSTEDKKDRIRLLSAMIDNLNRRSDTTKVFASYRSNAYDEFKKEICQKNQRRLLKARKEIHRVRKKLNLFDRT